MKIHEKLDDLKFWPWWPRNDLKTSAASKSGKSILFQITFLKSVASTDQNEFSK